MAIQTSVITLSGKLDKTIHYTRNGQNYTRKKPEKYNLSENSKKSGTEFSTASRAGALIRKGLEPILTMVADEGLLNRLNKNLAAVIRTGNKHEKGKRQVIDGDVALLKAMKFNNERAVGNLITNIPEVAIDAKRAIRVTIPKLQPTIFKNKPKSATGAIIKLQACICDFEKGIAGVATAEDLVIPLKKNFPGGSIEFELQKANNKVIIVAVGIGYIDKRGYNYDSGKYKAGTLLEAVVIRNGKIVTFKYPALKAATPEPWPENKNVSWVINDDED